MRILYTLIISILYCWMLTSCKKSIEFKELPPITKPADTIVVAKPDLPDGVSTTLSSNSSSWLLTFNSTDESALKLPNQIVTDNAGNTYALINYYGILNLAPFPQIVPAGNYAGRPILVKYDVNGRYVWSKKFDSYDAVEGRKLLVDKQGNLIVLVNTSKSTIFKYGDDVYNISKPATGIIIKASATDGNIIWIKQADSDSYIRINDIALDSEDDIYFTGGFNVSIRFNKDPNSVFIRYGLGFTFLAKYNKDGKYIFSKIILPDHGNLFYSNPPLIAVDLSKNITIVGASAVLPDDVDEVIKSTTIVDGPYTFETNNFVTQYDRDGNWIWFKPIRLYLTKKISTVSSDASGNIYIAGNEGFPQEVNFLKKISKNGSDLWDKKIQFGISSDPIIAKIDSHNNIFLAGDCLYDVRSQSYAGENIALYINKYTSDGNPIYAKKITAKNILGYVSPRDVDISNGNLTVLGIFKKSLNFFGDSKDPSFPVSSLTKSMFIARFQDKP